MRMDRLGCFLFCVAIWATFIIVCSWLSGCSTPAPPPVVKLTCLPLVTYTPEQEAAMAAELVAAPSLAQAMADYGKMRDADRACLGK